MEEAWRDEAPVESDKTKAEPVNNVGKMLPTMQIIDDADYPKKPRQKAL